MIKRTIKKLVSLLGYEVRSLKLPKSVNPYDHQHILDNFLNLTIAHENLLTNNSDLIQPNKNRFKLLCRLQGTPPSEAYFLINSLFKTNEISGDICEFGVAQGETSALIANEIKSLNNKKLHLFDSFEGLPPPTEKDTLKDDIFSLGSIANYEGEMSYSEERVLARLGAISFPESRYVIHKGFIEDLIENASTLPKKVSFAYVDFDFYEPIKIALAFLHGVTKKNSIIIVDDYDWFSTGAKKAVDEFIKSKNKHGKLYDFNVPDNKYGYFAILTRIKE